MLNITKKIRFFFVKIILMLYKVQGDWSPWSAWSMCSVTCEGGLRSRARTCNTTEPINEDLKLVCEGGESEESESCHEFSCIPGQYYSISIITIMCM